MKAGLLAMPYHVTENTTKPYLTCPEHLLVEAALFINLAIYI